MFGQLAKTLADKIPDQVLEQIASKIPLGGENQGTSNPTPAVTQFSSNLSGRKKALLIGINYFNSESALNGCINDVHNVRQFIMTHYGFSGDNMVILTDDQTNPQFQPTKHNMMQAFQWLVQGAAPGDSLFLHYSGHGSQQRDENGNEEDGFDETIVPVDYKQAGQIVDDDLNRILVQPLPAGARLTAIFDCCHSGTVLDLNYIYNVDGKLDITMNNRREGTVSMMKAGLQFLAGNKQSALEFAKRGFSQLRGGSGGQSGRTTQAVPDPVGDVVMFSGCRDTQTSADAKIDGNATGAMSYSLIKVLSKQPRVTFLDLLRGMRQELEGKYTQVPQMSSGKYLEMEEAFQI